MKILNLSKQDAKTIVVLNLFALTCLCSLMVLLRVNMTHRYGYLFLVWNLFLAWIPLVLAYFLHYHYFDQKRNLMIMGIISFLWLLFFPNAPYLVTDLMHLNREMPYLPLVFDTLLLFSFAMVGLMAGYVSLYFIHSILKNICSEIISWLMIGFIITLSSFGIYLGRVLRANSWDIFTRPEKLLKNSISSLSDPIAIKMTLMFSFFMLFSYLILYSIINMNQRRI